jgi:hypothetical protein
MLSFKGGHDEMRWMREMDLNPNVGAAITVFSLSQTLDN